MLTEAVVTGGAELFALRLASSLRRNGTHCDLLCLHSDMVDRRVLESNPDLPVRVLRIPALRWVKRLDRALDILDYAPLRTTLSLRWMNTHLRTRYDVVHSHLFGADWIATKLKQGRPDFRVVSTLHGDYKVYEERRQSAPERTSHHDWPSRRDRVLGAVDRFVYISEEQRRQFQEDFRLPARRLTGIYNGVGALNAVRQKQGAAFTIAMAARGSIPEKGWLALIRAFQQLRGDVRLLLIGEGEYLQGLATSFAADERIIFAGFHPEPARLIASADIFVLPTTYAAESLPTVIIEALSVGCPVIATCAGEIRAVLTTQQGPAGTLLPLSDEQSLVQNISRALQCYIDNPRLLEEHSARARDAFKPLDMMTCTARYQNLYAEVIEEGGRSSSTSASH